MAPELVESGMQLAAVALIFGAVISVVTGTANLLGGQLRATLEPALSAVRSSVDFSRSQLADASILLAIAFSSLAVVLERSLFAILVAALLWYARPMVRRLSTQENPLLALGDSFSADLIIGLYLPIVMAQVLLGRWLSGAAMLMVVIALSWPPGGARTGRRTGGWQPTWQA